MNSLSVLAKFRICQNVEERKDRFKKNQKKVVNIVHKIDLLTYSNSRQYSWNLNILSLYFHSTSRLLTLLSYFT